MAGRWHRERCCPQGAVPGPPPRSHIIRPPGRRHGHAPWLATERSRAARSASVYGSLTCLNTVLTVNFRVPTVTHREDNGVHLDGQITANYPFRNLSTTFVIVTEIGFVDFSSYCLPPVATSLRRLRMAPADHGVSVLFQRNKEYCSGRAQAVRDSRIGTPTSQAWAGPGWGQDQPGSHLDRAPPQCLCSCKC